MKRLPNPDTEFGTYGDSMHGMGMYGRGIKESSIEKSLYDFIRLYSKMVQLNTDQPYINGRHNVLACSSEIKRLYNHIEPKINQLAHDDRDVFNRIHSYFAYYIKNTD